MQIYSQRLSADDVSKLAAWQAIVGLAGILKTPAAERTAEQRDQVRRYYLENVDEPFRKLSADIAALAKQKVEIEKTIPPTMVMGDTPTPRPVFVLKRGPYDQPGEPVSSGVPASLPPRIPQRRWPLDSAS